jgi:hypothetical protein
MNAKYRAKNPKLGAGALALLAWLASSYAAADDGYLTQPLQIQQHKSAFQLKLEQVEQQARRRAAAGHAARSAQTNAAASTDLGSPDQSMRLTPLAVADSMTSSIGPDDAERINGQQTFERHQQRILSQRQQRRALVGGPDTVGLGGDSRYAAKRSQLQRFSVQDQRLTLQRKLRY